MGREIQSSTLHSYLPQKDTSRCSLPAGQKDIYSQASRQKDIYSQIVWLRIRYINPNKYNSLEQERREAELCLLKLDKSGVVGSQS